MLKRSSLPDKRFEPDMALDGLVVDFCCADLCLAFDLADRARDAKARTRQLEAVGVRLVTLPTQPFTRWYMFVARSHVSQTKRYEIYIARSRMEYIADWGCKAPF